MYIGSLETDKQASNLVILWKRKWFFSVSKQVSVKQLGTNFLKIKKKAFKEVEKFFVVQIGWFNDWKLVTIFCKYNSEEKFKELMKMSWNHFPLVSNK